MVGGVMTGESVTGVSTRLTSAITDSDSVIPVTSTAGFADTGFINIELERIGYSSKTATTFKGNLARPTVRGANDTEAVAHVSGTAVRTVESMILNNSMDYNIAVISDVSGIMAFETIPLAIFDAIRSFIFLPLSFLGTDMQIITYLWAAMILGLVITVGLAVLGGRRV